DCAVPSFASVAAIREGTTPRLKPLRTDRMADGRSLLSAPARGKASTALARRLEYEEKPVDQRLIRALPPPATWSSSSSVICDVSPRVLIYSAPWATPRLTQSCGLLPVRKP